MTSDGAICRNLKPWAQEGEELLTDHQHQVPNALGHWAVDGLVIAGAC